MIEYEYGMAWNAKTGAPLTNAELVVEIGRLKKTAAKLANAVLHTRDNIVDYVNKLQCEQTTLTEALLEYEETLKA